MSLMIFVSQKSVIISKYNVEFPFVAPPEKMGDAALEAYNLLRCSESLQMRSSRDQREEVITLLQHYGFSLYKAIIPKNLEPFIHKEGGIFIFSLDNDLLSLPWELLFDGISFFALTQGVVRIDDSGFSPNLRLFNPSISQLGLSLNSFNPVPGGQNQKESAKVSNISNRFISYIEELSTGELVNVSRLNFKINSNASAKSIISGLETYPNLFLFSGYDLEKGWILENLEGLTGNSTLFNSQFQLKFSEAVQNGLRILFLITSDLIPHESENGNDPFKKFFDLGIPVIISVHGRLARVRLKQYFQNLVFYLAREENILKSHRHAINSLQNSIPLSWDWSWIQIRINKNLLNRATISPLDPFEFFTEPGIRDNQTSPKKLDWLDFLGFPGTLSVLNDVTRGLINANKNETISLFSSQGFPQEEYLKEYLKRLSYNQEIAFSLFYYQRWGFSGAIEDQFKKNPLAKSFAFIYTEQEIIQYFDFCLLEKNNPPAAKLKFMLILSPPESKDKLFDKWLTIKQKQGWTIIFITGKSGLTDLPNREISTEKVNLKDIVTRFEDEFPDVWKPFLEEPRKSKLRSYRLFRIAQQSGSETVMQLFHTDTTHSWLWEKCLKNLFAKASITEIKIFLICYYYRVRCEAELVLYLIGAVSIDEEIGNLLRFEVLNTDIESTKLWIPSDVRRFGEPRRYFSNIQLTTFLKELLQRHVSGLYKTQNPLKESIIGFQFAVSELVYQGGGKTAIHRNLQFAKILSSNNYKDKALFYYIIRVSLEWAVLEGDPEIQNKTILSAMNILESLPLEREVILLYEWLLGLEEKKRNWTLLSELQMKLASLYIRLNEKEKALGLLTSTIFLSQDINNNTIKYHNQISIALLFLDLEEFDKTRSIINNADFDLRLINKENLAKLWLIDAHLLFQENKFTESLESFSKSWEGTQDSVTPGLLAKTYHSIAIINHQLGHAEQYLECLRKAADLFEKSANLIKALEIHEILSQSFVDANQTEQAIYHLEWLYQHPALSNKQDKIRHIAHQLGGLYFKKGDQVKSTQYYKKAQKLEEV